MLTPETHKHSHYTAVKVQGIASVALPSISPYTFPIDPCLPGDVGFASWGNNGIVVSCDCAIKELFHLKDCTSQSPQRFKCSARPIVQGQDARVFSFSSATVRSNGNILLRVDGHESWGATITKEFDIAFFTGQMTPNGRQARYQVNVDGALSFSASQGCGRDDLLALRVQGKGGLLRTEFWSGGSLVWSTTSDPFDGLYIIRVTLLSVHETCGVIYSVAHVKLEEDAKTDKLHLCVFAHWMQNTHGIAYEAQRDITPREPGKLLSFFKIDEWTSEYHKVTTRACTRGWSLIVAHVPNREHRNRTNSATTLYEFTGVSGTVRYAALHMDAHKNVWPVVSPDNTIHLLVDTDRVCMIDDWPQITAPLRTEVRPLIKRPPLNLDDDAPFRLSDESGAEYIYARFELDDLRRRAMESGLSNEKLADEMLLAVALGASQSGKRRISEEEAELPPAKAATPESE
jgi:hypothetical protein